MSKTVYALFKKGLIEDYYPIKTLYGIYSSKEEADKALDMLEVKCKAFKLNQYMRFKIAPENTREHWELQKYQLEQNMSRKQEGSKGWKRERQTYDQVCKILQTRDFDKQETFEEWASGEARTITFRPDAYEIVEVEMNSLLKTKSYFNEF